MAQTELFRRYIWLVDLIYRYNGITRDEINHCWSRSYLNTDKESEIPERTFHRHKDAIKELFDVDIVCDRHGEKTYHIANREALNKDGVKEWLLSTFTVNNVLSESEDIKDRILLESIPSGQHFLTPIIEAMRDGKVLHFSYQSFTMDNPMSYNVEPYCLKIYKQRWYLLGRRPDRGVMRLYALDRIKELESTDKTFSLPKSFDAEKYFENTVGIVIEDNCNPQTVRIHAINGAENYIRSLPLHPTQKEVTSWRGGAKFEIFVQPNNDLIHELLVYGENVTVLFPKWFKDKIRKIANKMNNNYSEE
ncbi:MAG: WYL domain-containing protein [Muribaculaceae bacterium]|nr:WYL domain-containing protein [Muribaculaceae bacterium]